MPPLTIQYCSDLHLEFPENWKFMQKKPLIPTGEILVLAGDILPFTLRHKFNDFFDYLSASFAAVYWVPGNHEYYGSEMAADVSLFEKIRDNFFLVNNRQIRYKEVQLVFSTLWSPIAPQNEWEIRKSIADYRAIRLNDRNLLPADINAIHQQCRSFLETALADSPKPESSQTAFPDGKTQKIVITHHVPTFLNYPAQYRNSPLTEAFAVELHDLIENSGADYWIYGHHHVNTPPFRIGATGLITNQLGYVRLNEQRRFRRDAVITVS